MKPMRQLLPQLLSLPRLRIPATARWKVTLTAEKLGQTYGLQAAGFEVLCLEARQVSAALSAMRNKTDRNDARGIAQILRTGW